MKEQGLHLTDEQLLLHASGELRAASGSRIQSHLEDCSPCRRRLQELESTLTKFSEAHRNAWTEELPPVAAPRALLKARLAELTAREPALGEGRTAEHVNGWLRSAWAALTEQRKPVALTAAVVACLLLAIRLHGPIYRSQEMSAALGHWEEPDLRLTPGATVPVTENDVCGVAAEKPEPVVPVSLARKVFEVYGVTPPQPNAYEVDYLITPQLGGATDIRNLWPEPYQDTVWNAHVKDQLEDRLHQMVCHGDVDLATAQHDISTDWIAAYRKYFHADRPVAHSSSSNVSSSGHSLPVT
jgi:hypothetical protein